jgi:hypothetical protein
MIKPGLLYRSANPRALKGKNKNLLPVYWQSNKKAWVTVQLFLDWFHHCFLPEVEKYLASKGMEFKVLLIIDNVPGHLDSLQFSHANVEVVFLPPDTTPPIQPLDQGVIRAFKAYYTRRSFARIRTATDNEPDLDVMQCWKDYSIADCITNISETVNACWRKLWP